MPGCNGSLGLACVGAAGSKTCVTISYVSDGMPCGNLSNTSFALCKAGTCYTADRRRERQPDGDLQARRDRGRVVRHRARPSVHDPCAVRGNERRRYLRPLHPAHRQRLRFVRSDCPPTRALLREKRLHLLPGYYPASERAMQAP